MVPKKLIVLFISCAFVLLVASSCFENQWIFFHDKEIKGSVVDAETKTPIEGVIVVAMWRLSQIASEGFGGYAKVIEVTTDKDGKFTIPSWMTFKPLTANSVMHDNAPEIVIYKPGYQFYYSHKYQRERLPYSVNYSEEERKTFKEKYSINPTKLKRIFTDEEKAKNIIEARDAVKFFMIGEGLSKSDIKLLLKALEEEKLNLSDKFRNALPK